MYVEDSNTLECSNTRLRHRPATIEVRYNLQFSLRLAKKFTINHECMMYRFFMSGIHIRVRLHTPTFTTACPCSYRVCDGFLKNSKTRGAHIRKLNVSVCVLLHFNAFFWLFKQDIRLSKPVDAPAARLKVFYTKKKHRMHVLQKLTKAANIRQPKTNFVYAPTALLTAFH